MSEDNEQAVTEETDVQSETVTEESGAQEQKKDDLDTLLAELSRKPGSPPNRRPKPNPMTTPPSASSVSNSSCWSVIIERTSARPSRQSGVILTQISSMMLSWTPG